MTAQHAAGGSDGAQAFIVKDLAGLEKWLFTSHTPAFELKFVAFFIFQHPMARHDLYGDGTDVGDGHDVIERIVTGP